MGHLAHLERGEKKGPHFHALFFYDGSKVEKDIYYAMRIGEYWKGRITGGRGLYFNCNAKKSDYEKCGIGLIRQDDEEKRRKAERMSVLIFAGSILTAMFEMTKHAAIVIAARGIHDEWIEHALLHPAKAHGDSDDPALEHHLAPISSFGFRVLRVVYKRGSVPPLVITAYFDRTMKGKL